MHVARSAIGLDVLWMSRCNVIPAYAGIQIPETSWIPAPVSRLAPYVIRERDKLRGHDHAPVRTVCPRSRVQNTL
jgi:hypothetical protein